MPSPGTTLTGTNTMAFTWVAVYRDGSHLRQYTPVQAPTSFDGWALEVENAAGLKSYRSPDGQPHLLYPDGNFYRAFSTEHIQRSQLKKFILLDHLGKPFLAQHLEPGKRLIYRRRTQIAPGKPNEVIHLLGWQQTLNDDNGQPKCVQHIAYISEDDGRIEMAGQFRGQHPYDEPAWLPCDQIAVE